MLGAVDVSPPFTLTLAASDVNLAPVSCQLLYSVAAGSLKLFVFLGHTPWHSEYVKQTLSNIIILGIFVKLFVFQTLFCGK